MTQYNSVNVTLPYLQINKQKSAIKKGTDVNLNISSIMVDDSNDETDIGRINY